MIWIYLGFVAGGIVFLAGWRWKDRRRRPDIFNKDEYFDRDDA